MDDNSTINFLEKNCIEEGHEDGKLVALCIDKNCNIPNKFICLECLFNQHEQHKVIKLKQVQDKLNEVMHNGSADESVEVFRNKLKETENKIQLELENIKTNILEILNNKVNIFITDTYDQFSKLFEKSREDIDVVRLIKKDFQTLTQDELTTLTGFITSNFLSQSVVIDEGTTTTSQNKKCPLEELDKYINNLRPFLADNNRIICDFLNNKFLANYSLLFNNSNLVFEWTNKAYGNYGFLYTLSTNKQMATKSTSDGTITIIRGRDKLGQENYYIEFLFDSKKGGDIEIGIGRDTVGTSCWLRTQGAYGITNMGIYEYGKLVKKDEKIEDGNIVGLELNMRTAKTGRIFKNTKLIHEFKIDIDEVYIMAAVRKVGNSILVKEFKII
jgi:hypothetical protein